MNGMTDWMKATHAALRSNAVIVSNRGSLGDPSETQPDRSPPLFWQLR
ncbi:hypothetical protein RESH_02402 [Rhodopirellula europaea SH398]|uniref:Uncharacterized protein n=2 Tax=Rhodopirellula europaea TaxID=1263866 RepID=M5S631_9BACT|nr:hypothetical protein RE6C_01741 [Rhodopirellula europaea 6C]EMI27098.1 hypothetical protein RESH_02402 [Rhodopirellula europaea SH398]